MNATEIDRVREYAVSIFSCGQHSIHGPRHWRKVEDTALLIASRTAADPVVCRLFACLHDCCRLDDGEDLDHGQRAAELVRRLSGSLLRLDGHREDLLVRAVSRHTYGDVTAEPSIGACWDADRLDLGRVGIIPHPDYMSTPVGKELAAAAVDRQG